MKMLSKHEEKILGEGSMKLDLSIFKYSIALFQAYNIVIS